MRARIVAVSALAGLLVACSGGNIPDGRDPGVEPAPDFELAGALAPFDACEEFLSHVTEHALEMVGPWGLGGGMAMETDAQAEEGGAQRSADDGAAAPVEGRDYSGTNVQEAGVDEPDTVKTDGERLFLARGEWLDIVDVSGSTPELVSSTRLGGWGNELLRAGDRLLVLGGTDGHHEGRGDPMGGSGAQVRLYDIADPADPVLVSTLRLDGRVLSARLVDGVARVVLRAEPVGLPFVTPEGSGLWAEREATKRNREIIEESTVDNWVPYYVHEPAYGPADEGTLLSCDQVHHPEEFSGLGTTSVLSLDATGDLSPRGSVGVLAGGETVYASSDRLYTATNRWIDWESLSDEDAREANERYTTELHAFDISDPTAARYVGSGSVRGHVLNQWGLSAHDGVLRVATTEGSQWWGRENSVSESFVTTFAERDGALVERGQVGGLGRDERIYAVRFMGDLGYVVTFRETDPLYTLDLSDPADPRVLGELKILGYSAYLHPIGDDLLLGVGQDADKRGRTQGLQLSLFDVSDLADPKRIDQVTLTDAHSGVEWDHHAFLHWPRTGLTVVPYESWTWEEDTETESVDNGALAYTLDRDEGFTDLGKLTHLPDGVRDTSDARYADVAWRAAIRRSIVINDRLFTVSDLGVEAVELDSLDELSWTELPAREG